MIKYSILLFAFCLFAPTVFSQSDSTKAGINSIFERIGKEVKDYRLDTTNAPNDKIMRKIIELRNLRGGFNINEALEYKLEEDRQKNEVPKEELDNLSNFFKSGNGKKWLDNAVIWIYREHFSYKELKQLVKFYKTEAGQKMATDFPVIMMQTLTAGEMIRNLYAQQKK